MSEDRIEGAAREGLGRLQDAFGGLVGDGATQARGKLNEAFGSAQHAYGRAKDGALDVFDEAGDQLQRALGDVEDYVREDPLKALAIGVGIGLTLGLLLWGGRKAVYLRR